MMVHMLPTPPDKHDEGVERKNNGWNKNKPSSTTAESGNNPTNDRLTLSNNLKAAMITNFQCTSEQAEKLWSKVVQDLVK